MLLINAANCSNDIFLDAFQKKLNINRDISNIRNPYMYNKKTLLSFAINAGDSKLIDYIIKGKPNLDSSFLTFNDSMGEDLQSASYTSMHDACYLGDVSTVKKLIKAGAFVDSTSSIDESPLMSAVLSKSVNSDDILKLLINSNANVNWTNIFGESPLYYISNKVYNYKDKLTTLIESGCSIDSIDHQGQTCIEKYVLDDSLGLLDMSLNKVDVNDSFAALQGFNLAIAKGKINAVKYFIESGINFNSFNNPNSRPAIFSAILHKNKDLILYFLRKGSNPYLKNSDKNGIEFYLKSIFNGQKCDIDKKIKECIDVLECCESIFKEELDIKSSLSTNNNSNSLCKI